MPADKLVITELGSRLSATSGIVELMEDLGQAMGGKYTSDFVVRYFNHPLTMRLTPEP